MEAIVALAEIGPESQPAVPDLIVLLNGADASVHRPAAYALGRIGTGAKDAIPVLRRLQQSRNRHEQAVASWALVHISPDAETIQSALPLIIQALQDSHVSEVRVEAAKTLGEFGKGSAAAKEAVKNAAAKDADETVRKTAEEALVKLK